METRGAPVGAPLHDRGLGRWALSVVTNLPGPQVMCEGIINLSAVAWCVQAKELH